MVQKRVAFTMIEVILVLVVIGILTAVALPKLAGNRDDAAAKVCEMEATTLLQELTGYYAKHSTFDRIGNMSNIKTGTLLVESQNGIAQIATEVPALDGNAVEYVCNGEILVTYQPVTYEFTNLQGRIIRQAGMTTTGNSAVKSNVAKIVYSEFMKKHWFKPDTPGYVIGSNN
ncbi:prepilin-type N-terminal cleavage/methylation domain-containing protein [Sulfurovum sp. zt1-1]|uniref:Prepilin-type N-terminal cleavage/methylation domain-containing protein n=1 Tax=Sulfurovum zhangzhouensis TaxID=3019067 RepID=A0ABT7QX61_9BACT|nr:prepilin-type N-terminal cleavage/methylation domain-containing protein [Sulfurovum zhangzhouensis]MDM5271424.1 prepilin-type N-terminal cleavage/methylation domain-containing protein [Sulfurovum zhangzhouensis]